MNKAIQDKEEILNYNEACLKAYGVNLSNLSNMKQLTKVNSIMTQYFSKDTKYNINAQDLALFSSLICSLRLKSFIQLKTILNSSFHYANYNKQNLQLAKEDNVILIKQLIIAFAYSFHCWPSHSIQFLLKTLEIILGLGRKMKSSGLITNESFVFLFKFGFMFSLYDENESTSTAYDFPYYSIIYSMIRQLTLVTTIEGIEDCNETEALIMPIIDYITIRIKENISLLNLLKSSNELIDALRLVQCSHLKSIPKQKIIGLIATVYAGNYNESIFKNISLMIKESLHHYSQVNKTKEDIKLLIGQLSLVKEMIGVERKALMDAPYYYNMGFIMTSNPKCGLSIEMNQMKGKNKPSSIIFAFNAHEILPEKEYPLLSFSSDSDCSKDNYLRISIKSNEFIISSKSIYRGVYEFKPNRIYLVTIDWKPKSVFTSAVSLNIVINNDVLFSKDKKRDDLDLKLNENFWLVFGSPLIGPIERNFNGKILPLMLLKKPIEEQFNKTLFDMPDAYGDILNSFIDCDMSYYSKYNPVKGDQTMKSKEYEDLLRFVRENVLLVVSPMSIIPQIMTSKKNKGIYQDVIYDFKNGIKGKEYKYVFHTRPNATNCALYLYQYNSTISEFLRYDGMSIIALHLEYYYNLLHQKIGSQIQIEIMKGVSNTIKLVVFYLDLSKVNFDVLKDEYSTILFSIFKVVSLLTETNISLIQDIGDELINLLKAILSLRKKPDFPRVLCEFSCQMFIFLLKPKIFPLTDASLLKKLFHSLNIFLEDYAEADNLVTILTLVMLFDKHILLSGEYLHENYFIPNKIPIHQIAQSSYKEYKNMRKEYETLLGTFISKGDISILFKVLCFICDSSTLVIRYKLLKIFYFSRNTNLKEMKEKKENKLTKKYNDLYSAYSSLDTAQRNSNPNEEKYRELIKSILLQLLLELKEKDDKEHSKKEEKENKDKDKQLYEEIKSIKNSLVHNSSVSNKDKSNSSLNSQTNSSNNTSTMPDLKSAPLIKIKNIVINGSISFFEVKSIFLLPYVAWDLKAKFYFITERNSLKNEDYLKCYTSYNLCLDSFNKHKKNHWLFFIQLLYRIQSQEDSTADSTMLLFCNYLYQIFIAYTQSKVFIQPNIQCQFIHLFESRSIMCSFFTICFQSIEGGKYAKAALLAITPALIWKHPNPFIFKFLYSHMKINPAEVIFLLKHIADCFIESITVSDSPQAQLQLIPLDNCINIIRFIIVAHKLICFNRITKEIFEYIDASDSLINLLKLFKERTLFLYSNLLIPISKKNKVNKTLYQIYQELILQLYDIMEIERKIKEIKELIWQDENSFFYHLDMRKKKSNSKSKKSKQSSFNEALLLESEGELKEKFNAKNTETRIIVLEFYINLIRLIARMKLIGMNLNYDSLLVLLRAEIISLYSTFGSDSFSKEDNLSTNALLYNEALKFVQLLYTNKKPKNGGACLTANDIFLQIDNLIRQSVEIEYNDKKDRLEKSIKSVEKSEISEPGTGNGSTKEIPTIKTGERKYSFSSCEYKCIEGGLRKSSAKNVINDLTADINISSCDFSDISIDNPIFCMKRDLLLKPFAVYFDDIYFSNKNFDDLKRKYQAMYKRDDPSNCYYTQDEAQTLRYPSKLKNYSSNKNFYPRMFLKQDQNFFKKSNRFFKVCCKHFSKEDFSYKQIKVKHGLLNNKNNTLFSSSSTMNIHCVFPCERISNEMICFGYLYITKYYLLYQSDPEFNPALEYNSNKNYLYSSHVFDIEQRPKQIMIQLRKINELLSRRFLFQPQAIEVFLNNGKSYFFNLFSIKKQLEFIKVIESANNTIPIIRNPKEEFLTGKNYQLQWRNDQLSTFDYLLLINKYSGRSYNDLNQYPIIPWVFTQLKDNPEKRDLKLPISVQYENEQKRANEKFSNPISKKYPSHFGIHFSNSAFVNTFLIRFLPFTYNQIKFQNNKFDFPDRQFTSLDSIVKSLSSHLDNRELIPEIYLMPEYAYNLNYVDFGRKDKDKNQVNNVYFPEAFNSPLSILFLMKSALNGQSSKENINYWIDMIFGINQKRIQKGCYVYPKQTYEQYIIPKFEAFQKAFESNQINQAKMFDAVRKKICSIIPIGQFPGQLFDSLHIQVKSKNTDEYDYIESLTNVVTPYSSIQKNLPNKPILFFSKSFNTSLLFCLIKNLGKKGIAILDMDLNPKNIFPLDRMALMEKTDSNNRIYHPKYCIFELNNCDVFITCRYYDNTIKVITVSKKFQYSILTESFVNCIKAIDANSFYSGHKNGKLMQWEIQLEEGQFKSLNSTKSVIAHDGGIVAIEVNLKHEIVLTSGEDNKVFIRKMYDFELLCVYTLTESLIGVDIHMSALYDVVYVKIYDSIEKKFHIRLYSMNGLLLEETESQIWFDLYITENNKYFYLDSNQTLCILSRDLTEMQSVLTLKNSVSSMYYYEKKKMMFVSYTNADISRTSISLGK